MMLNDTECKICKTKLEWKGSFTNGHMVCPNRYCHSNMTDQEFRALGTSPRAEELEYDVAE